VIWKMRREEGKTLLSSDFPLCTQTASVVAPPRIDNLSNPRPFVAGM
jgi:hypothetical protein